MTNEPLSRNLPTKPQFTPFIPIRIVATLVALGAAIMLLGYFSFDWIDTSYLNGSAPGMAICYGWWRYLVPAVAVLALVGLVARAWLKVHAAWPFWIGTAILGLSGFYPFFRLLNPGPDVLLGNVAINHRPGLWVVSETQATFAGTGFYVALAGALLLFVSALSGLPGRAKPNDR